jgi:hypothetical protein
MVNEETLMTELRHERIGTASLGSIPTAKLASYWLRIGFESGSIWLSFGFVFGVNSADFCQKIGFVSEKNGCLPYSCVPRRSFDPDPI